MSDTRTTKSFKSQKTDKTPHGVGGTKKGGAGGKGTWGVETDDVKFVGQDLHAADNNDPNYDPIDMKEGSWKAHSWTPTKESDETFKLSVSNLREFKTKVKAACAEYLTSNDAKEFQTCVGELGAPVFHQDIPAIALKLSLDRTSEEQSKISHLLQIVHKDGLVSTSQMTQGFRKLLNSVDELTVDYPNARPIIAEMLGAARAHGLVDQKEAGDMEHYFVQLSNPEASAAFAASKKRLAADVSLYLNEESFDELKQSVSTYNPAIHFEVIKALVSKSLDRDDRQRELSSKALAALSGSSIEVNEVVKGFTILLGRVEDLHLDVPDILRLLACFIARAVADEAVPPAFLVRVDLSDADMGSQVLRQASHLMNQPQAALRLSGVWGAAMAEDE